jgi:hypothetical protein
MGNERFLHGMQVLVIGGLTANHSMGPAGVWTRHGDQWRAQNIAVALIRPTTSEVRL